MKEQIEKLIKEALKNLEIAEEVSFVVEHPEDFKNGDYSTNVAMVCARKTAKEASEYTGNKITSNQVMEIGKWKSPKELAELIKIELEKSLQKEISKVEVAGAGFINFYLSKDFFCRKYK